MRFIAVLPLLIVAACGGEAEKNAAAPKAARLAPGQWELATEVTGFTTLDQDAPKIDTPVGTRATESVCVGAGQAGTDLFSGENFSCQTDNYYVRNGRINVTMQCGREGLSGTIAMTVSGTFTEDSLEYDRDLRTALASDGDVQVTTHVTGRRTGECAPETDDGNQSNGSAG